ncbi:hypothetical protein HDU67_005215 [Dinochytrium kinnereticum]|nr:hypothetical protein HDU67_005215 [Dinochytrium kinnereticum]
MSQESPSWRPHDGAMPRVHSFPSPHAPQRRHKRSSKKPKAIPAFELFDPRPPSEAARQKFAEIELAAFRGYDIDCHLPARILSGACQESRRGHLQETSVAPAAEATCVVHSLSGLSEVATSDDGGTVSEISSAKNDLPNARPHLDAEPLGPVVTEDEPVLPSTENALDDAPQNECMESETLNVEVASDNEESAQPHQEAQPLKSLLATMDSIPSLTEPGLEQVPIASDETGKDTNQAVVTADDSTTTPPVSTTSKILCGTLLNAARTTAGIAGRIVGWGLRLPVIGSVLKKIGSVILDVAVSSTFTCMDLAVKVTAPASPQTPRTHPSKGFFGSIKSMLGHASSAVYSSILFAPARAAAYYFDEGLVCFVGSRLPKF